MQLYLWVNAALYLLFAVWCTVAPSSTATSLGYVNRNSAGHSEYLVIYGGLQLGLVLFFAWTANRSDLHSVGVIFGLMLYAPIVIYRWITVIKFWPVPSMTVGVGVLETVLLVWALVLFQRHHLQI